MGNQRNYGLSILIFFLYKFTSWCALARMRLSETILIVDNEQKKKKNRGRNKFFFLIIKDKKTISLKISKNWKRDGFARKTRAHVTRLGASYTLSRSAAVIVVRGPVLSPPPPPRADRRRAGNVRACVCRTRRRRSLRNQVLTRESAYAADEYTLYIYTYYTYITYIYIYIYIHVYRSTHEGPRGSPPFQPLLYRPPGPPPAALHTPDTLPQTDGYY